MTLTLKVRAGTLVCCLATSMVGVLPLSAGAQQDPYYLEFGQRDEQTELRLSIGKSQIIRSQRALDQVVIGNPAVADIKLLSSTQVLILGIKPGHTNLVFKDKNRDLVALMDVVVGYDITGIKRKVYEIMPQEGDIEIRGSNDSVILSGQVSDTSSLEKVLSITRSYVPEKKVVNLLQVGGGHQVMLEVKVSEVARNSLKQLGIDSEFIKFGGGSASSLTIGSSVFLEDAITPDGPLTLPREVVQGFFGNLSFAEVGGDLVDIVGIRLRALERKGLARTLAEPNIVALSGQEADFLVGGEVPVPVPRSSGIGGGETVTIEFKEFGVGLRFTPTVLSNNQINLKLRAEVSAIDDSRDFALGGGIVIPSFTTRRMGSTVEMGDGQSFAIAGLLQNDLTETIRQFPWLGHIPVLGALFRSSAYQREETELVVVVTPRLVKPGDDQLVLPTDIIVPPSEADFYLLGRMEGRALVGEDKKGTRKRQPDAAASGIEGEFGHE